MSVFGRMEGKRKGACKSKGERTGGKSKGTVVSFLLHVEIEASIREDLRVLFLEFLLQSSLSSVILVLRRVQSKSRSA